VLYFLIKRFYNIIRFHKGSKLPNTTPTHNQQHVVVRNITVFSLYKERCFGVLHHRHKNNVTNIEGFIFKYKGENTPFLVYFFKSVNQHFKKHLLTIQTFLCLLIQLFVVGKFNKAVYGKTNRPHGLGYFFCIR
jgi:hypothetical protein